MDSNRVGMRLLHRGAEADLFLSKLGPWDAVVKKRVRKKYRNLELDLRIRRERTSKEAAVLNDARRAGVRTPVVLSVDCEKHAISMTLVRGTTARDALDTMPPHSRRTVFRELGRQVGLLHQAGIAHGDLTTSNIMITQNATPCVLDFGMSAYSSEPEDRGIDLHLLRKSIVTSHVVDPEACSRAVLSGYAEVTGPQEAKLTLRKTAEISRRGRYFALR